MKNLFLIFFTFFGQLALCQINMKWEALPKHGYSPCVFQYQTNEGHLIAYVRSSDKIIISKDKFKTWETLITPKLDNGIYASYYNDENGGIYLRDKKKLYKLDTIKKQFTLYFTIPYDNIKDIKFGNNKIYLAVEQGIYIYNRQDLKQISSRLLTINYAQIVLGNNNKNYIVIQDKTDVSISVFNDIGEGFINYGIKNNLDFDTGLICLASGKLMAIFDSLTYFSNDNGLSWNKITNLDTKFSCLKVISSKKNEIILVTDNGLFYSKDEGASWTKRTNPPYKININTQLFLLLAENYIIIQNSNSKTLVSNDMGITWDIVNIDADIPQSIRIYISYEDDIINKNGHPSFNQILRSDTSSWNSFPINDTMGLYGIIAFPSGKWLGHNVYYYQNQPRHFTSKDKGRTWSRYDKIPEGVNESAFGFNLNQNKELVLLYFDKYYISKDEGETWMEINAPNLNLSYFGEYDFFYPVFVHNGYIMAIISEQNCYKLNVYDSIKKQTKKIEGFNGYYCSFTGQPQFTKDNKFCFLYTDKTTKLYITKDYATTFIIKNCPLVTSQIRRFFIDTSNNFIIQTDDNIYISFDEGNSWYSIKGNLPTNSKITSISISPSQYLYIGMEGQPIYKTVSPLSQKHKLKGRVFADKNNNCIKDGNEKYLSNIKVRVDGISNWQSKTTDSIGYFSFDTFEGDYTLTLDVNPLVYENCQPFYKINVGKYSDTVQYDIPVKTINYCPSLDISLTTPLLRRCFDNTYQGLICNNGSIDAIATTIEVNLDPFFDFQSTSLPILQKSDQKMLLDVGLLRAGVCKQFTIKGKISCTSKLGQEHCIYALAAANNECAFDDRKGKIYIECQKNIGSFDPNDKSSFVNGKKDLKQVKTGDELEYLIRFQNTGTDTAFNIIIKDTISNKLDIKSILMGSSSHRYSWEIKDNVLYVNFKNIMLPDSNINEPQSHGFIKFRIEPDNKVTVKDLIYNTAAIYFDYNEPIHTNKVTLNEKITQNKEKSLESLSFIIYPNPTNDKLSIVSDEIQNSEKTIAKVYSIEGKELFQLSFSGKNTTFSTAELTKGVYIIALESEGKKAIKRFVIVD